MTVLPVGAVSATLSSASLSGSSATLAAERALGASGGSPASAANHLNLGSSSGTAGAFAGSPLEGVEGGARLAGVQGAGGPGALEGTGGVEGVGAPTGAQGAGGEETGGGFGEALTHAISSLETTQQSSDGAAQALATGTAGNPESAVVTVEDAQLAMQLASQIRSKAVEATQQIFQTQV